MQQPRSPSVALSILDEIRRTDSLAGDAIRRESHGKHLPAHVVSSVTHLVLGVLRHRRYLDFILERVVDKKLPRKDKRLMDLLRLATFELHFSTRSTPSAAVHNYVSMAKRTKGHRVSGFVNAVLRRVAIIEPDKLTALEDEMPIAVRYSLPDWLDSGLSEAFGPETQNQREFLNSPSPIWLRLNPARADRESLVEELSNWELEIGPAGALRNAVCLSPNSHPYATLPFHDGWFWPQDIASQLVSELSRLAPPGIWLDACSGNGTKSLDWLADPKESVVPIAADLKWVKLRQFRTRTETLGLSLPYQLAADMRHPPFLESSLQLVLLDAPCTGVGTIRRHPELRWRRQERDVSVHAKRQMELLDAAARLVSPGGMLVYAVCSFLPAEGRNQIDAFLLRHPEFEAYTAIDDFFESKRLKLPSSMQEEAQTGCLLIPPSWLNSDSFFISVLVRKQ